MDDKLVNFQSPIVMSAGILLGFLFNAASTWALRPSSGSKFREAIVAVGLCLCTTLLLIVLYRSLNMHYPKDKADSYYKRTLHIYVVGLSITFLSFILIKLETVFL